MEARNRNLTGPESGNGINPSNGCVEHAYAPIQGFCKDCSSGICFRCAISKHRNHNMVDIEELTKVDLEPMIATFDVKLEHLTEKAKSLLEKAKSQETNAEKLPEIEKQFEVIRDRFQQGIYNEMIIGELNRNYKTI
jgi:hypothetical protein